MNKQKNLILPKLPHGEGSFTLKNGTYYYRKVILTANGRKKRIGVQGDTVKACLAIMKEKEKKYESSNVSTSKTSLIDAMKLWLETIKKNTLKTQSYIRLESTIRNQIEKSDIALMRYQSITTEELQLFINSLNTGEYSFSTIKKVYDALNEFYKYVSAKDHFFNPMLLVVKPSAENTIKETKEIVWFDEDDIEKFVKQAGAKWMTGNPRYNGGLAYAANIYIGLRIGELLALKWEDIDFENKRIYICKTLIECKNPFYDKNIPGSKKVLFKVQKYPKTSKNRYVKLNSKAIKLLLEYKSLCRYTEPENFVICTRNRKSTTEKNANDTIKAIQKAAHTKVQGASSHSLRHTCASLLYKKGVRSEMIAAILGNSPEVSKKTYIHFEEMQEFQALNLIVGDDIEL